VSTKKWYAADVITTRDDREAIEYGLMEGGALGTETTESEEEVRITAYFENPVDEDSVRKAISAALHIYDRGASNAVKFEVREIPDRDWLAEWKKSWQPVQVGRFIIAPPWIESVPIGTEPLAVASGLKRREIKS